MSISICFQGASAAALPLKEGTLTLIVFETGLTSLLPLCVMVIVAVPGPFAFITPCWSTEITAGLPEEYRSVSPDDAFASSDLVPPVSGNVNAEIEYMIWLDRFFSLT